MNNIEIDEKNAFRIWAFVRCLFFYLPGVSILFFATLVSTHFLVFMGESVRRFTPVLFWFGLGAFVTMFGIGKLGELKYLKVVAAVVLASFVITLSFFFVPDELKGKFFGSYSLYFLPVIALVGFLTKRGIDREKIELL